MPSVGGAGDFLPVSVISLLGSVVCFGFPQRPEKRVPLNSWSNYKHSRPNGPLALALHPKPYARLHPHHNPE